MPRRALLIAETNDVRRRVARGLKNRGWDVEAVDEPYEASARLGERPFDLVLAFLGVFEDADLQLIENLRSRWPSTRCVAIVGEGERLRGHEAMRRGATSWIPEPSDETDIDALVNLFPPPPSPLGTLQHLSRELAHLVGNRLVPLRAIADDDGFPPALRATQIRAVEELDASRKLLNRLYDLPDHRRQRVRLRDLLTKGVVSLAMNDRVQDPGMSGPSGGPWILGDERALRLAVEAAVDGLVGLAGKDEPLPVKIRVVRPKDRYEAFLRHTGSRAEVVEGRVWVEGLRSSAEQIRELEEQLLWRQDGTGRVHWGAWLPRYLAHRDGGRLQFRRSQTATGVAFVFARE